MIQVVLKPVNPRQSFYIWLFVLICTLSPVEGGAIGVAGAASGLVVGAIDDSDVFKIGPEHAQYYLETEALTVADIFALSPQDWHALDRKTINTGKQKTPVWFRIKLKNQLTTDITKLIELRWTHIRKVDFYQRRAGGEIIHREAGLAVAGYQQYADSTSYVFPLPLTAGEETDILFRLVSAYNINLPLFVWDKEHFPVQHANHLIWYYLALGALVAMTLYNSSLYLFTRDKSYFYYSLYALSILIYEVSITGIGNRYVWGESEWLRFNVFPGSINLSFLCSVLFVRNFLELKRHGGWLLLLNNIVITYWALNTVLVFCGLYWLYVLAEPMITFTCFAGLGSGIYLWIKGSVSARYFTIAWSALILFTMATMIMMDGRLPRNFITENGQIIGFLLELLLLSFALAERINREREQREHAQRHALILQTEISNERENRMQAQQELLELQKQTNIELEARVAERTDELTNAMSELEFANRKLEKLSVTDPLTELSNRRYFDEVLERELLRIQRTRKPLALVMLDIDHFKQINDTFGHLVGDDCLKLVAKTLSRMVNRSTDLIARYGGEEFILILADTGGEDAYLVAERIRTEIENLNLIKFGKRVEIRASMGVASVSEGEVITVSRLVGAADKALYQAKSNGRNCSVLATF